VAKVVAAKGFWEQTNSADGDLEEVEVTQRRREQEEMPTLGRRRRTDPN
jgi:hypothetical protein